MAYAFDRHPGIVTRDKTDPLKVISVALRGDEVYPDSSVRMMNKKQLDEVAFFLNSIRHELPDD